MTTWHLDHDLAGRYSGGRVNDVLAASVEQHLVACAACRTLITVDAPRLDTVWAAIVEEVEAPRPRLLERSLRKVGISGQTAHLVAATPLLRGAWATGVVVLLGLAFLASHSSPRGTAVFVALAPVLPVLGVALAFSPRTDPALDMAAASPYSLVRLLAVRTAFVVATTMVPAAGLALFLPGTHWMTLGWLLPALAMCAVVLAAARHVEPHLSAGVLAVAWLGLTAWLRAAGDPLLVDHGPLVQLVSIVALALAGWHLIVTRNDLVPHRRTA